MQTFDRTRPDIGAAACGLMRRALDESVPFALERKTFGVPIAQHQAVQHMLAEMAIKYEATRLLVHKAAWMIDRHERSSVVSATARPSAPTAPCRSRPTRCRSSAASATCADYPVEKLMRDAKILQIYEGTSQIQRMVIAKNILAQYQ